VLIARIPHREQHSVGALLVFLNAEVSVPKAADLEVRIWHRLIDRHFAIERRGFGRLAKQMDGTCGLRRKGLGSEGDTCQERQETNGASRGTVKTPQSFASVYLHFQTPVTDRVNDRQIS